MSEVPDCCLAVMVVVLSLAIYWGISHLWLFGPRDEFHVRNECPDCGEVHDDDDDKTAD